MIWDSLGEQLQDLSIVRSLTLRDAEQNSKLPMTLSCKSQSAAMAAAQKLVMAHYRVRRKWHCLRTVWLYNNTGRQKMFNRIILFSSVAGLKNLETFCLKMYIFMNVFWGMLLQNIARQLGTNLDDEFECLARVKTKKSPSQPFLQPPA